MTTSPCPVRVYETDDDERATDEDRRRHRALLVERVERPISAILRRWLPTIAPRFAQRESDKGPFWDLLVADPARTEALLRSFAETEADRLGAVLFNFTVPDLRVAWADPVPTNLCSYSLRWKSRQAALDAERPPATVAA